MKLTEAQYFFLKKLAESQKGFKGPSPEFQGNCVHLPAPELHDLVQKKLVSRRPILHPHDTDNHVAQPDYLKFTHRYRIRVAGRAALGAEEKDSRQ